MYRDTRFKIQNSKFKIQDSELKISDFKFQIVLIQMRRRFALFVETLHNTACFERINK